MIKYKNLHISVVADPESPLIQNQLADPKAINVRSTPDERSHQNRFNSSRTKYFLFLPLF
jgi:hypothetical protein